MSYTVVKYDNWLNSLNFGDFTAVDQNLFFSICAMIKEKGLDPITISFDDIREMTNYTKNSNSSFIADLQRMNEKLLKVTGTLKLSDEEETIIQFNLFSYFKVKKKSKTLTVAINPNFKFVLNGLLTEFTILDLPVFISLSSKYSKELYRQFRQWKSVGKFPRVSVEKMREMLKVPESYSNHKFYQRIIEPSVKELNEKGAFRNLRCTIKHSRKQGQPVTGYVFTWALEKVKAITKVDNIRSELETVSGREMPKTLDPIDINIEAFFPDLKRAGNAESFTKSYGTVTDDIITDEQKNEALETLRLDYAM